MLGLTVQPSRPSSASNDKEIAGFGCSGQLVVERPDGRVSIFGGKQNTAIRHLQASAGAQAGKGNGGICGERQLVDFKLSQGGLRRIQLAGPSRRDQNLPQRQRVGTEIIIDRGAQKRLGPRM